MSDRSNSTGYQSCTKLILSQLNQVLNRSGSHTLSRQLRLTAVTGSTQLRSRNSALCSTTTSSVFRLHYAWPSRLSTTSLQVRLSRSTRWPTSVFMSVGCRQVPATINDVSNRVLDAASFYSALKPVVLCRGDVHRPDGITVLLFRQCRALVWYAMCTDTFAPSNLFVSATNPGCAYIATNVRNRPKYTNLTQDYIFLSVVVETSGLMYPDASRNNNNNGYS